MKLQTSHQAEYQWYCILGF